MDVPLQIVIIDDKPAALDTFITELEIVYGENSVKTFANSKTGLDYIFGNLTKKMIVILDYDLSQNKYDEDKTGLDVLKKIREKTSLLTVIICTTKPLNEIPPPDLVAFINNHIFTFIDKFGDETMGKVEIVEKAVLFMNKQIDTVLEEWILRRTATEREIPHMRTKSGKTYSLNDLLFEIRNQTPLGIELQTNMLNITIDSLTRDKEQLND